MIIHESFVDLSMTHSIMRVHLFRPRTLHDKDPTCPQAKFAAICVFTEIYQVTGPVARLCRKLASLGLIVACPESYHEFEPPGTILSYDEIGTNKGNGYKIQKKTSDFDADAAALINYLTTTREDVVDGCIGALGMCLGGHLALRCAFMPQVITAVCYFPTDVQEGSLGLEGDDTLDKMTSLSDANTELLFIFGKQDRHVPEKGRNRIRARLHEVGADFAWLEVNARHAFIRDECSKGRYDAELNDAIFGLTKELLNRRLVQGMPSMANVEPQKEASGPDRC